jgi:hypothetical protein
VELPRLLQERILQPHYYSKEVIMAIKQKQTHKAGTMKQTKKTNTQTGKSKVVHQRVKPK